MTVPTHPIIGTTVGTIPDHPITVQVEEDVLHTEGMVKEERKPISWSELAEIKAQIVDAKGYDPQCPCLLAWAHSRACTVCACLVVRNSPVVQSSVVCLPKLCTVHMAVCEPKKHCCVCKACVKV